jgi:hypothetical protein
MIEIVRLTKSDKGVFGALLMDGFPQCWTLEDPDNNNAKQVSCIPEGAYKVGPHSGQKYQDVWILKDVPGRDAILIHNGNTIRDTQGCILVGAKFGFLYGLPAVLDSNFALANLREKLPKNFDLTIRSI